MQATFGCSPQCSCQPNAERDGSEVLLQHGNRQVHALGALSQGSPSNRTMGQSRPLVCPAMKAAIIAGCVVLSVQCAASGAHADTEANSWKGAWQDCESHNFPDRPACVGRPCEGNWPGPEDQCGPKAQSPRWLARTERQRE